MTQEAQQETIVVELPEKQEVTPQVPVSTKAGAISRKVAAGGIRIGKVLCVGAWRVGKEFHAGWKAEANKSKQQ